MTIQKKVLVFLILSCFLFATVFSVSGCGGLASLVTTAASTSLGGMEAWVFVPAAGAKNASHTSKVTPPAGFIALPGATLTIVGTGYSAVTDSSGYASITGLANGTYTVTVAKEGYKTFTYTVTVATGEDTVVGGSSGVQTETSTAPGIMNLSATSGAIGSSLTITGVNFGSTQGTSTVQFNGIDVTDVTSWSSTSIMCKVPAGATTGNVVVKVGSESSNSVSFTVTGGGTPVIDHLTPEEGAEGASVTITGSNFGSSQGNSAVTFYNGKTATIVSPSDWSDTTIITTVPGQAETGDVIVTVGGVDSNKVNFGVLAWRTMDSKTAQSINAVWGTSDGSEVFGACTDYKIVRYTAAGGTWSEINIPDFNGHAFQGIWGTNDGASVFAVGDEGKIRKSTDGGFTWANSASGIGEHTVNGIWGSSIGQIYAVSSTGDDVTNIRLFSDGAWGGSASPTENNLLAVWGSSSSNIYAAGASGTIAHCISGTWNTVPDSKATSSIRGIWGTSDGGNIIAVCQSDGAIVYSTNSGSTWKKWTSTQTGVTVQLNGIWGSASTDVFVVGNTGTIIHFNGSAWSTMTLPFGTTQDLYGVWGTSSSNVYAVGANGKILHYGTE